MNSKLLNLIKSWILPSFANWKWNCKKCLPLEQQLPGGQFDWASAQCSLDIRTDLRPPPAPGQSWHKDYNRWEQMIKDHIEDGNSCRPLYHGKVVFIRSKLFNGWHKSIVSSDWSDTMVWFGQILLYLSFTILYIWSLDTVHNIFLLLLFPLVSTSTAFCDL